MSELAEYLRSNSNSLRINWNCEGARRYYSVELRTCDEEFRVGLCVAGHGPSPEFLLVRHAAVLLIGYDLEVSAIGLDTHKVIFCCNMGTVFLGFVYEQIENSILVIHELGAFRLEFGGKEKWSVSAKDIVKEFIYADGFLFLNTEGRPSGIQIEVLSGSVAKEGEFEQLLRESNVRIVK